MRTLLAFLFSFCFFYSRANAGDNDYAITRIPVSLMKNVNVVKRSETMRYAITEKNKAVLYRKVAYTILNELGDDWSYFSAGYDKLRSIESFEGALYDALGKKIKSLKRGDVKDVSGTDDASLADDSRVKWHSFYYKVYPYTVEYEVEIKYKGTMFSPRWMPQERPIMSVESSSLEVVCPASNPLRYKMFNYEGEPSITDDKANKIYKWNIKDRSAIISEYAAPAWYETTTTVLLATERFMLEDYEGSNASWKDFGKFVYDLKKGRDELPANVKQKVHELTDHLTDAKEKVKKLYEYMQQNTRYISIQLGIGGWQPFDAKFVAEKKYGDCKALSNFMYSLLKEAGIRSVYTVINAGDNNNYLIQDMPGSQFNHVVLFVPHANDTTWLECTSQTVAAGYMGGGTSNRWALAVEETGGTLVRTPNYGAVENLQVRNIKATVNETGYLSALISTTYKGEQQDRLHSITNGLSKDKLMEFLKEDIELPTYDVKSFNYMEHKASLPAIDETLDLVAPNYATVSGKRFFVVPNIITRTHRRWKAEENRKLDIVLGFAYKDVDSVEIIIPEGYTPEAVPQPVQLDTKFGKYEATIKVEKNKIIYYRNYEHFSGRYPAKDYADLVKFYDAAYKADRNRIVFVKNEEPQPSAAQKAF